MNGTRRYIQAADRLREQGPKVPVYRIRRDRRSRVWRVRAGRRAQPEGDRRAQVPHVLGYARQRQHRCGSGPALQRTRGSGEMVVRRRARGGRSGQSGHRGSRSVLAAGRQAGWDVSVLRVLAARDQDDAQAGRRDPSGGHRTAGAEYDLAVGSGQEHGPLQGRGAAQPHRVVQRQEDVHLHPPPEALLRVRRLAERIARRSRAVSPSDRAGAAAEGLPAFGVGRI